MMPFEFVEKYPIGTRIILDFRKFGLEGYAENGTYEYLGESKYECKWKKGCFKFSRCKGRQLRFRNIETGKLYDKCWSFQNSKINGMPIIEILSIKILEDDLFDI